jgi:hypothetical protein
MLTTADSDGSVPSATGSVIDDAVNRFLCALCAWGPTHALRAKDSLS